MDFSGHTDISTEVVDVGDLKKFRHVPQTFCKTSLCKPLLYPLAEQAALTPYFIFIILSDRVFFSFSCWLVPAFERRLTLVKLVLY